MEKTREDRLQAFHKRLAECDEAQILCIERGLSAEIDLAYEMLEAIDKRLEYLERFNFQNITKLAKECEEP